MQNMYDSMLYAMSLASDTHFELLKSTTRLRSIVIPRQIVWHYLYSQGYTLQQVGAMCDKHHTTILHGLKCVKYDLAHDRIDTCVIYSKFLRILAEQARSRNSYE